jgi:pimeloyl-ACP methyl ester carboxylesterase
MKRRFVIMSVLGILPVDAIAQAPEMPREFISTALVEDGKPIRLELLVQRPSGPGPFPTVVFNHGSTGRGDNPELFRRSWASSAAAAYFVDRGWMIIFPQRRGRGASEGRYDEGFETDRSRYSCQPNLSLLGVDRAIEDLDAVMAHVRTRSDVLQSKILLAGQSRGGILSVAYAGERPDAFVGVVNFVGGWMGDRCANAVAINTATFKRGARFQRPTLWLYGDADPFYSLSHSKGNFDAFLAAGGKGRFESYWVPGQNTGHTVITHPRLWTEHLTQYLDSIR